jgi:solute carrier family 30 (zinc transporter), member 1
LVVGSAGLASNIVGLVLFHDHGHSHGDHSHEEESEHGGHTHDIESGHAHSHSHPHQPRSRPTSSGHDAAMDDSGPITDILPETIVRRASNAGSRPRPSFDRSPSKRNKRGSRQSFASADDIFVSPAANRQYVINQAQEIRSDIHEEDSGGEEVDEGYNGDTIETVPVENGHKRSSSIPHDMHHHSKPKDPSKSGGHSHENLNMRGVFLHVLGDALGNIGVIATALFIWLTDFSWRFYSDPVISLVITAIIFSSALPLVKSASLILLQGVPRGISLEDVKEDILQVYRHQLN